ncbi:YHS domain-containing protein [bacterium]|nr:YHS domain-containing protein [bacterium]
MRSLKHALTALVLVFGLVSVAQAGDADKKSEADAPKELKNQTHCPVMGGKIDSTVYTDIQGQRVYHCCPMCSDKLKADPDKFFKKAAGEGVLFENIQSTCPVSGEILEDKSVYSDYEGRRVVFCCKKCRGTFNEDPEKYLKKLDEDADSKSENMKKMDHSDHSGHNH